MARLYRLVPLDADRQDWDDPDLRKVLQGAKLHVMTTTAPEKLVVIRHPRGMPMDAVRDMHRVLRARREADPSLPPFLICSDDIEFFRLEEEKGGTHEQRDDLAASAGP